MLPALERGILAGHDLILLGERGQAKTRLIRQMVDLLDEQTPVIAGCEVNDHPYRPICARCRALVAERGRRDAGRLDRPRRPRTPRSSRRRTRAVADLIGDVDPIRVAEGRYLADELTIHYGLIPRTNRGIVAINELPDLPERIQVALFNILEERDVQIRGYRIRLPLDLLLVATANPDDYTHRGRIVSPLKDRFGTQVRTHYPETLGDEVAIMEQEARAGRPATCPGARARVHEGDPGGADGRAPALAAREPPQRRERPVLDREPRDARRGRRPARRADRRARGRAARRATCPPSSSRSLGRVEFDTIEEGREEEILSRAARTAELEVFRRRLSGFDFQPILARFDDGVRGRDLGPHAGAASSWRSSATLPGLAQAARPPRRRGGDRPAWPPRALEFALEGLHLSRRLNKDLERGRARAGTAPPTRRVAPGLATP